MKVTSTSCHERVPQVPIIGFVFCSTITCIHAVYYMIIMIFIVIIIVTVIIILASRYPGKTFLGGYFGSVVPHSVLLSTSSKVYIDLESIIIIIIMTIIIIIMIMSDQFEIERMHRTPAPPVPRPASFT